MKQLDTTTEAGWDACVKAYYAGEEIELISFHEGAGWCKSNIHPMNWTPQTIRRIKPQRVPEMGDVWEYDCSLGIIVGEVTDSVSIAFLNGHKICVDIDLLTKFIGKIDLSLLENNNE